MPDHSLRIVNVGEVGEARNGDQFRYVTFQDTMNDKKADLLLYRKKDPGLWADSDEFEGGGVSPPYKGQILQHEGIDLVLFGFEDPGDSVIRERWSATVSKKISYREAERMRKASTGFVTDLTHPGAMEIGWRTIDRSAMKIRFRKYEGSGNFSWSQWIEII